MFEKKPDWRYIKSEVDLARIKVDQTVGQWKHDLLYGRLVSRENHERGSTTAEAFIAEAMGFLSENPAAKLKSLNPSREQLQLMHYLFESIDGGVLRLEETKGRVWEKDRAFISKLYKAKTNQEDDGSSLGLEESMTSWSHRKNVTVGVRWGIHEPFPHGFSIFGNLGMKNPGTLDFITLPEKPTTAEQVNEILRIPKRDRTFESQVSLFDKGGRIVIDSRGTLNGQEIQTTEQHFLIGAFEGEQTNRTYWLYGSNSDTNMTTSKQTVRERQLAPQRSGL